MGKQVYQDRHADCSECKAPFKITVREQIFLQTLGYRSPKKCVPCRRKSKKEKPTGERLSCSIRTMFEAGDFEQLFQSREESGKTIPEVKAVTVVGDGVSRTPTQHVGDLKRFFGLIPISADQPAASLDDIKVLMTRAGDMCWPDDAAKCRKQNCSENDHVHPYFKSGEAKIMIQFLYQAESSKQLRKPQIDFLYEEFGKVLSGRAYLDRDSQGNIYVTTPLGSTEEEVRKNVLTYS